MPTSRFFWKLVLTCAGLNFLAAVVVGLVGITLYFGNSMALELKAARMPVCGTMSLSGKC